MFVAGDWQRLASYRFDVVIEARIVPAVIVPIQVMRTRLLIVARSKRGMPLRSDTVKSSS